MEEEVPQEPGGAAASVLYRLRFEPSPLQHVYHSLDLELGEPPLSREENAENLAVVLALAERQHHMVPHGLHHLDGAAEPRRIIILYGRACKKKARPF